MASKIEQQAHLGGSGCGYIYLWDCERHDICPNGSWFFLCLWH